MPNQQYNTIAIKRRIVGAPGAPASLSAAELAYNQIDNTLYYGFSSIETDSVVPVAIAGPGFLRKLWNSFWELRNSIW